MKNISQTKDIGLFIIACKKMKNKTRPRQLKPKFKVYEFIQYAQIVQ